MAGAAGQGASGTQEISAAPGFLGWLPALALTGALGLLLVAEAMHIAAGAAALAQPLFWIGVLVIYTPVLYRLSRSEAGRAERILLVAWLGLALYVVKILREPAAFEFHDEFPHWRTAYDIAVHGRLFHTNSLQEISAAFPGLEIVTAALSELSHLSLYASGTIVIGLARLVAMLGLFFLYEQVTGSSRLAGLGVALSIVYPNFVFWSSQFSYESLALPIAIVVLFVVARRSRKAVAETPGDASIALLLVATVVITHHLTSYWLVATLATVYVAARVQPRLVPAIRRTIERLPLRMRRVLHTPWAEPHRELSPSLWGELGLIAAVSSFVWLILAGGQILDYIGPHFKRMAGGVIGLVTGQSAGRSLFDAPSPVAAVPAWERLMGFLAVGLIAAALPFGILALWRRYRTNAVALVFMAAAVLYPITLLVRLSSGGAEIANRSWDFLFVGLGAVLAAGAEVFWLSRGRNARRALAVALAGSLALIGGLVVGTPAWARLPGPYMVGGDTRGIQAESTAMAHWARDRLGPDNRMIADYSNKLLLGSYGGQYIVDGASWIYLSPKLAEGEELAELVDRGVEYVVVDTRLSEQVPRTGVYFEGGEPRAGEYIRPFDLSLLAKFDQASCLSRVFDSGNISVYRVAPSCGGSPAE